MCHYYHALEFLVALFCYAWLWPQTFPHAGTLSLKWIWKVVAFNLACEAIFYGGWHYMTYAGPHVNKHLKAHKYDAREQYEGGGHLAREVLFTTLGWLQSSAFMVAMMHLWASGRVPYVADFWARPAFNIGSVLFVTYWREFHFYWCHRFMHPWFPLPEGGGLKSAASFDPGRLIYKYVHALHHKSVNPGPFSGLSMSPFEHLFYYSCTLLPLLMPLHPMHFL
jgi:sterol desaturase/sphingolipid hydroxylase (fatty acid hydroxylase superfamily)